MKWQRIVRQRAIQHNTSEARQPIEDVIEGINQETREYYAKVADSFTNLPFTPDAWEEFESAYNTRVRDNRNIREEGKLLAFVHRFDKTLSPMKWKGTHYPHHILHAGGIYYNAAGKYLGFVASLAKAGNELGDID